MRDATSKNALIKMLDNAIDAAPGTFDICQSVGDPKVRICVPRGVVPPFRFKAGGWDLLHSSIDLGPAMKSRIDENGFFMCRLIEGGSGWTELNDLPRSTVSN